LPKVVAVVAALAGRTDTMGVQVVAAQGHKPMWLEQLLLVLVGQRTVMLVAQVLL
jgi:hypothetical protein